MARATDSRKSGSPTRRWICVSTMVLDSRCIPASRVYSYVNTRSIDRFLYCAHAALLSDARECDERASLQRESRAWSYTDVSDTREHTWMNRRLSCRPRIPREITSSRSAAPRGGSRVHRAVTGVTADSSRDIYAEVQQSRNGRRFAT